MSAALAEVKANELLALQLEDQEMQRLIERLGDVAGQSGVSPDLQVEALLDLGLSTAIYAKDPQRTWGQLKRGLLLKVAENFEAMVKIVEAERSAA